MMITTRSGRRWTENTDGSLSCIFISFLPPQPTHQRRAAIDGRSPRFTAVLERDQEKHHGVDGDDEDKRPGGDHPVLLPHSRRRHDQRVQAHRLCQVVGKAERRRYGQDENSQLDMPLLHETSAPSNARLAAPRPRQQVTPPTGANRACCSSHQPSALSQRRWVVRRLLGACLSEPWRS